MRNRTFAQLLEDVRLESGRSPSTTLGQNEEAALKHRINRAYEFFWFDHDWAFLKIMDAEKAVSAGVFKIDPPTEIDLDRIEKVDVRYGNIWHPVERGLDTTYYNIQDNDDNERSEPIERYDIQWTGSAPQLVLWPRTSVDTTLRFQGRKAFVPLVNDSDICLLDDQLLYLHVAAELLAKQEDPSAGTVATAAGRRYSILKYGLTRNRNSKFNMNSGGTRDQGTNQGRGEVRVAVAPTSL